MLLFLRKTNSYWQAVLDIHRGRCSETGDNESRKFYFGLKGAVLASDAFFPFADCVEIAHMAGITAIIQPGGVNTG